VSVLAEFMQMTNLTLAKNVAKNRLSKNSELLKSLPPYIQDNFPAWLIHRSGIDM